MPIGFQRRIIAAKVEGTPGTAETLADADAAIIAFDPAVTPPSDFQARAPGTAYPNMTKGVPGRPFAGLRVRVELRGKGASGYPIWVESLLAGCGFLRASTVCKPKTAIASQTPITIAEYAGLPGAGGCVVKKLIGAMGNVAFTFEAGRICFADFDFQGMWVPPVDGTMPTATHEAAVPPAFGGTAMTLGALTPKVERVTLDMGNVLAARPDSTKAGGFGYFCVTDRKPVLSMEPEADLVAAHDLFGLLTAQTEVAWALTLNGGTNNTLAFAAAKAQFREVSAAGDREGIMTHPFQADLHGTSGDDEVSLTLT